MKGQISSFYFVNCWNKKDNLNRMMDFFFNSLIIDILTYKVLRLARGASIQSLEELTDLFFNIIISNCNKSLKCLNIYTDIDQGV